MIEPCWLSVSDGNVHANEGGKPAPCVEGGHDRLHGGGAQAHGLGESGVVSPRAVAAKRAFGILCVAEGSGFSMLPTARCDLS